MLLRICLVAFWSLCSLAAWGQSPFQGWQDQELELTFSARGLESGKVLDLKIRNTGDTRKVLHLPQFTVLEPLDSRFTPVILESYGGWEVQPGADFTFRLSGYSLEHGREVPGAGQQVRYRPTRGKGQYKAAQYALREGLKLERQGRFEPLVLSRERHRVVVLQRVVWRAVGGGNPDNPEQLHSDVVRALRSRGKSVSEKATGALVASIWRDVEKVYQSLAAQS